MVARLSLQLFLAFAVEGCNRRRGGDAPKAEPPGRNFVFTGGRKKDSNETAYKDGLTR
jgi:hypothetical protein